MLVFLLHSMKLLFTKPIPPNPAPSKIIPIISETLYIYLIGFHPRRRLRRLAGRIRNPVKPKPPLRHRLHPDAAAGERRTAHCRPQNLHRMDKGTSAATVRTLRRHAPHRTQRGATGIFPRTIVQTRPRAGRELHRRSR